MDFVGKHARALAGTLTAGLIPVMKNIEQLETRLHLSVNPTPAPVTGLTVTPGQYVSAGKKYDDFVIHWKLSAVPKTAIPGHVWGEELIVKNQDNVVIDTVWLSPGTSYAIGGAGFIPGNRYTFGVVQVDEISGKYNQFYESDPTWIAAQAK